MPKFTINSHLLKNIFNFQDPKMLTHEPSKLEVPIQPTGEEVSYTNFEEVYRIITMKETEMPGYHFTLDISYTHYEAKTFNDEKPVMVFLHGCMSSQRIFSGVCKQLKESCGNEMVTLDFLGHGQSTKLRDLFTGNNSNTEVFTPDEQNKLIAFFYSPMSMVMQVVALLYELRVRGPNGGARIHLVGWSLGGYVAYGLANLHPSWVALLISLGAPPVPYNEAGWSSAYKKNTMEIMRQLSRVPKIMDLEAAQHIASYFGVATTEMFEDITSADSTFVDNYRKDVINSDPLARLIVFLNVFHSDAVTQRYLNGETCLKNSSAINQRYLNGETSLQGSSFMTRLFYGEKDGDISEEYLAAQKHNQKYKYVASPGYDKPVEVRVMSNAKHAVFLNEQAFQSIFNSIKLCSILSEYKREHKNRKMSKDSSGNTHKSWLLQWAIANKTPLLTVTAVVGAGLWLWSRSKNSKVPLLSSVGEQARGLIKEGSSYIKPFKP